MTKDFLRKLLTEHFPYEPTPGQEQLIGLISEFLLDRENRNLLVIKGYAGTGKTTLVKSVVDVLDMYNHGCVLLAPTGRSAKVLSNYSGKHAFTIHKKIYKLLQGNEGAVHLTLQQNFHKNTLFIVDEASMIANNTAGSGGNMFSGRALLDDLMEYVYNENNCRLILIGDTAQLPPAGMDISPALDISALKSGFGIKVRSFEMTEVVRQEAGSGILFNATALRKLIAADKKDYQPKFVLKGFNDIIRINSEELEDALNDAYSAHDAEETIVVCRSNKRANLYNGQIRARILGRESEICGGDLLMAVKNNYFWLPETSKAGFIANGEMMVVRRIRTAHNYYGFRFAEAIVSLIDYENEGDVDVILLLDTVTSEKPALSVEESRRLYEGIMDEYADIPEKRKRMRKVRENKFYNALQVKFAWALTCHKSQGGQWKNVFIEQGYLKENTVDKEYLRWLYTALTRATGKVYLVNFNEKFFN